MGSLIFLLEVVCVIQPFLRSPRRINRACPMAASAAPSEPDILIACLACGDPFTPASLARGSLPLLFSCGHTVCTECAEATALDVSGVALARSDSFPVSSGDYSCGLCRVNVSDRGVVNAGLVALVQCMAGDAAGAPGASPSRYSKKRKRVSPPAKPNVPHFSTLSSEASAALSSVQANMDRINTARSSMREEFESSKSDYVARVDKLLSSIISYRDRMIGQATRVYDEREKALCVQVEELTVKAALLRQAMGVCKSVVEGVVEDTPSVYESVKGSVSGLAAAPFYGLCVPPRVSLVFDARIVRKAMKSSTIVKDGVKPAMCTLEGSGFAGFDGAGLTSVQHTFTLLCKDHKNNVVTDVDLKDVSVHVVSADGGQAAGELVSITRTPEQPGSFTCVYVIDDLTLDAVDIDVRVHGEAVAGSPVRVPNLVWFVGNTTLPCETSPTWRMFTGLMKTWLLNAQRPTLLYRMSRDGAAASDFHSRCDGKVHTVTLIKSTDGFVFGGYADSDNKGLSSHGTAPFIFTVVNPHDIPPTRYLVKGHGSASITRGHPAYGPTFTGITVGAGDNTLTSKSSTPFANYWDTTRKGPATFTGSPDGTFFAAEVEVWHLPNDPARRPANMFFNRPTLGASVSAK